MPSRNETRGALEAVERILNRGGEADDVLRAVVGVLSRLYVYVGIAFVEGDRLVLGPSQGARTDRVSSFPICFQGRKVAELEVCPREEEPQAVAFLERVATLVSAHCLVGWDTGGVPWEEVG